VEVELAVVQEVELAVVQAVEVEVELELEVVVAAEPEQEEAVRLEEVQEPVQAAVAGLAPALVRPQGQASAPVQQLRSVLGLMRPSAPDLALQWARVRLAALGSAPVPVRPSVRVPAVRSGREPVMVQPTAPGTKGLGLKTEPALEHLSKNKDSTQVSAMTGAGPTCPSPFLSAKPSVNRRDANIITREEN
jgi:hypothetical protein